MGATFENRPISSELIMSHVSKHCDWNSIQLLFESFQWLQWRWVFHIFLVQFWSEKEKRFNFCSDHSDITTAAASSDFHFKKSHQILTLHSNCSRSKTNNPALKFAFKTKSHNHHNSSFPLSPCPHIVCMPEWREQICLYI